MIHPALRPASLCRAGDDRQKPLARGVMLIYTLIVHNHSSAVPLHFPGSQASAAKATVRKAVVADIAQITRLVNAYAAEGLMLPRTEAHVAARIDNYIVAGNAAGNVVACAALEEYSPSLAEVSSVAVAAGEHGKGLGTQVVLGVERLARARDIEEIFAMSLTDNFFLALDYQPTSVARYPEKLARYETLAKEGINIVPKRCYQKLLSAAWKAPHIVEAPKPKSAQRRKAG